MSGNSWRLTVRVGDDIRHLVEAMATENGLTPPQLVRVLVRSAAHRFRSGYDTDCAIPPASIGGPGASIGGPGASIGVTVTPASIGVNRRQSASIGGPGASIGVTETPPDPAPSHHPDLKEEEEAPSLLEPAQRWPADAEDVIKLKAILRDDELASRLTRAQLNVSRKAVAGRRLTVKQHETVSDALIQGMPDPVKPAAGTVDRVLERSQREADERRRAQEAARRAVGAGSESGPAADMALSLSELLAKRKREKHA